MTKNHTPERTRTITWEDPHTGAKAATTMSGLEYIQAMANGDIPAPPISRLIGMEVSLVEEGRVIFTLVPAEYHYNPIGSVHGGIAATLFDSALGCAIHTTLPHGTAYTTVELKVNYIRAITAKTGRVYCEGKVIHSGKQLATAEARLTDEEGKLYGHATTTCLVFRHH